MGGEAHVTKGRPPPIAAPHSRRETADDRLAAKDPGRKHATVDATGKRHWSPTSAALLGLASSTLVTHPEQNEELREALLVASTSDDTIGKGGKGGKGGEAAGRSSLRTVEVPSSNAESAAAADSSPPLAPRHSPLRRSPSYAQKLMAHSANGNATRRRLMATVTPAQLGNPARQRRCERHREKHQHRSKKDAEKQLRRDEEMRASLSMLSSSLAGSEHSCRSSELALAAEERGDRAFANPYGRSASRDSRDSSDILSEHSPWVGKTRRSHGDVGHTLSSHSFTSSHSQNNSRPREPPARRSTAAAGDLREDASQNDLIRLVSVTTDDLGSVGTRSVTGHGSSSSATPPQAAAAPPAPGPSVPISDTSRPAAAAAAAEDEVRCAHVAVTQSTKGVLATTNKQNSHPHPQPHAESRAAANALPPFRRPSSQLREDSHPRVDRAEESGVVGTSLFVPVESHVHPLEWSAMPKAVKQEVSEGARHDAEDSQPLPTDAISSSTATTAPSSTVKRADTAPSSHVWDPAPYAHILSPPAHDLPASHAQTPNASTVKNRRASAASRSPQLSFLADSSQRTLAAHVEQSEPDSQTLRRASLVAPAVPVTRACSSSVHCISASSSMTASPGASVSSRPPSHMPKTAQEAERKAALHALTASETHAASDDNKSHTTSHHTMVAATAAAAVPSSTPLTSSECWHWEDSALAHAPAGASLAPEKTSHDAPFIGASTVQPRGKEASASVLAATTTSRSQELTPTSADSTPTPCVKSHRTTSLPVVVNVGAPSGTATDDNVFAAYYPLLGESLQFHATAAPVPEGAVKGSSAPSLAHSRRSTAPAAATAAPAVAPSPTAWCLDAARPHEPRSTSNLSRTSPDASNASSKDMISVLPAGELPSSVLGSRGLPEYEFSCPL